ncbi:uroporphyrinogen-III C-methyltransferase [Piscinibacter sakaiensis]|uniref:uroporphyrinogen-III C-methyltransferase n=1 Tax=Piscinibacter sakaiensis TaxID=1547922 RepID=UPI003AAFD8F3
MSDTDIPPPPSNSPDRPIVARPGQTPDAARPAAVRAGVVPIIFIVVAGVVAVSGLALAWRADQRVRLLEQELVLRQRDIQQQATEARMLSQQTLDGLRESVAKVSLLEARLAEVGVQRGQLDELIVSLSRSRDENIVVEIESALRVAQQQSLLSGSTEPLVSALRQAEERLARHNQPRLEGVRRAIARDLDRIRSVSMADIGGLLLKLDEAVRMVDELPLLSSPEPRRAGNAARGANAASSAARLADAAASDAQSWWPQWAGFGAIDNFAQQVWAEVRSLLRVRQIDHPEAMLIAPDQAYFLRENLKLRLLNARLSLLSRQFDSAQRDLRTAMSSIERYFDTTSRRSQLALDLLRQIAGQARQGTIPLPDDSLAALTAAAGR